MAACIPQKVVDELLRKIAKKEEIEVARNTRIKIWDITDEDVSNMLKDGHTGRIPAESLQSNPIKSKLDSNLKYTRESTQQFIKNKLNQGGEGARLRAIALETILEQAKGEVDKARTNDVEIGTLASNGYVPDLALHRLAATIGRKLLYLRGYTVTKFAKDVSAGEEVEAIFYDFGMKAVLELQEQGFIEIHENGSQTIKDYLDSLHDSLPTRQKDRVTSDNPSISINLDAFGIEFKKNGTTKDSSHQEALKYFIDRSNANIKNHPMGEIIQVLNAVNLLSQPSYVSLPEIGSKPQDAGKHRDDAYERDPTMQKVTKEVAETPVYIDETIHDFLELLSVEVAKGAESASAIMKDLLLGKPGHMIGLFKQNLDNRAASQKESVKGRNLSSATPFDDLVEYWEHFKGKGKDIFLNMFAGRNARMYNDNSVLNPQTSKIMRHTLAVAPYTMKKGSDEHKFFIGKVAHELDVDPSYILGTAKPDDTLTLINESLGYFQDFVDSKNLNDKAVALSNMRAVSPSMDYAQLLVTLKAAQEIRNAFEAGSDVTTTYTASSDATASGGMLTLIQALGSNPAVAELLREMGILGKLKGKDRKTPDVYRILERQLNKFIDDAKTEGVNLELQDAEKTQSVMKMARDMLFKDIRDMAKKPTMTFIYGQSLGGAVRSIAGDLADRVMEQLKSGNTDVLNIINEILPDDAKKYTKNDINDILDNTEMMRTLIDGFVNSGMPAMMYDTLKGAVTNKYLREWQSRGGAIFALIQRYPQLVQMKVLPASAVREFGKPTEALLKKYGVPLTKIFSVRHDTYGAPVLTQEGKLTKTVMDVSQIHTADTSAAYRSVDGLPTKYGSGVIIIHDDIRSAIPLVMEAEKNYIGEVKALGNEYDIHEQVLLAAAALDPAIANDPDWIKFKAQVDTEMQTKRDLLKEFNDETDTIIGDSLTEVNFEGRTVAPDTAVTTPTVKSDANAVGLETLAGDSAIVSSFLESSNKAKVEMGDEAKFDPQTDTITIPKGVDPKQATEIAEHEIVHSWTAAAVQQYYQDGGAEALGYTNTKQANLDIGYVEKALKKLLKVDTTQLPDSQASAVSRIQAVALGGNATPEGVAELLAVLSAEPKVSAELYTVLNDKGQLPSVIKRIMNRIREVLSKVTFADFQDNNIDVEKLYSSVNAAVAEGKSMREQNYELTKELQKGFGNLYHTKPEAAEGTSHNYVDAANDAVSRILMDPAIRGTGNVLKSTDSYLDTHFPAYSIARQKIGKMYDENTELGQLIHTITNENINKEKKNTILSAFAKVRAAKTETTSVELSKFSKETSKLDAAQKKAFYDFTHKMPIHDFFLLKMDQEGITDFAKAAEETAVQFRPDELKALNGIVDMRTKNKITSDTKYSVRQIFNPKKGKGPAARRYIVLKTISEIGQDQWNNFAGQDKLFQLTRDAALANAVLNDTQRNHKMGDTLVDDWPEKPLDKRAVLEKDMWKYEYGEETGWEVYQAPKGNKPGIVYKRVIDQTYLEGAFTDIKYGSSDIDVGPEMRGMEGVVQTEDGFKLILDDKAKQSMGVANNGEQGLVRSMTHAMAIQDSQNIRDQLLERDTYRNLDTTKPSAVAAMIEDPNTDHPWFLGGNVAYADLPDKLKAKYKPVKGRLSDVEGFNDNIKFVRKDIEHWLIGKTERSIFTDPKWQWATRIVKDLVSGSKIGMVILNPMKIVGDNMSNVAYLSVRGVDPLYVQKQYREIAKQYHDYQGLMNKLNHMRVRAIAAPEKSAFKKKVSQLEKEIKAHPANGFVERGFVNSLGSDIVMRAGDPSQGFKADMDTVLKALLESKNGELNAAGKQLMRMANWNIGLDQFLEIWARVPASADSTKGVEAEMLKIARRLKNIKTEDDAVSYMHQYLNSPDSEFVKMGTYMTDLSDILAKETLYRHLTERKGRSPKEAEVDVIDSFPNYNENLPSRVKQLSDVGILMFPSFWMRIQRAIYRLAKDQPINFGTELSIEAALGVDAPTIWDANIWSKATSNYGIAHSPWEHIGVQSLIPMHAI